VSRRPAILVLGFANATFARMLPVLSDGGRWTLLLTDPPMIAAAAAAGIPHEAVRLPSDGDPVRDAVRHAARLFGDPERQTAITRALLPGSGGHLAPARHTRLLEAVGRLTAAGATGVELGRQLVATHDLRLALLGYDMVPVARGLLAVLERTGIPSLHVPHGIFAPVRGVVMPGTAAAIYASWVAAPGEFARATYAADGQPAERVVVTGAPRWDLLPALRAMSPAAVRAARGLDPARPLVVFATTWVEWISAHARAYAANLVHIVRGVLRGVRDAGMPAPRLLIKFHPSEAGSAGWPQVLDAYQTLCRQEGLSDVAFDAGDPLPWLAMADLVVSVNSTMAMEATIAHRLAMSVPSTPECVHDLYGADTAILTVASPDEMARAIGPALYDPAVHARVEARRAATIAHYTHADDGQSAHRVAMLAQRLADAGRVAAAGDLRYPLPA
jgi:hypothetical protein